MIPPLPPPAEIFALAYRLDREPRGAAESAIDAWLRAASPREILALAAAARAAFRQGVWTESVPLNAPIDPRWLARVSTRAPVAVAALLSIHRSGFVREVATRALVSEADPLVVPFVLLRADDIVDGIRQLAVSEVLALLLPPYAGAFARSLRIVELLRQRTRGGGGTLVAAVKDFLAQPACSAALLDACSDPDPVVRRAAFVLRLRGEPAVSVLAHALGDRDTAIRSWASRASVSRGRSEAEKRALLPRLESSRSAFARTLALRAHHLLGDDDAHLVAALLDSHVSVRYLARTLLRARHPGRPHGEARAYALEVLGSSGASARQIVGALGALADVGLAVDCEAVKPFTVDLRPRVRTEAERTLSTLGA